MNRGKRALRAVCAGIGAAVYVAVIGIVVAQFGEVAAFFFVVSSLTAFFTYIGS